MSNKLRQPRIAAQVCEIVHALSSRRVQNHKTLDERGFVVPPLCFVDSHGFLHAPRPPRFSARPPAAPGNGTLAPPAGFRPGRSRILRAAWDPLRTVTGTRLVK